MPRWAVRKMGGVEAVGANPEAGWSVSLPINWRAGFGL